MSIKSLTLPLFLLVTLAACNKTEAPATSSSGKDPEGLSAAPSDSTLGTKAEDLVTIKLEATSTLTNNAQGVPVINLMSPQAFVDSIQRIEPTLPDQDKVTFRLALAGMVEMSQFNIAEIAKTYGNPKQVPKFTDQQLLMITFGPFEGLTGPQAIQKARDMGFDLSAPPAP